jgi:hypothetical protein
MMCPGYQTRSPARRRAGAIEIHTRLTPRVLRQCRAVETDERRIAVEFVRHSELAEGGEHRDLALQRCIEPCTAQRNGIGIEVVRDETRRLGNGAGRDVAQFGLRNVSRAAQLGRDVEGRARDPLRRVLRDRDGTRRSRAHCDEAGDAAEHDRHDNENATMANVCSHRMVMAVAARVGGHRSSGRWG